MGFSCSEKQEDCRMDFSCCRTTEAYRAVLSCFSTEAYRAVFYASC
jgi:hypothetical protein